MGNTQQKYDNAEEQKSNTDKYEIVAAIDFGTSYTGYAYSYQHEKETIYINSNWSRASSIKKVPTAILFNDKKEFMAFGDDAVEMYIVQAI